MLHVVAPYEVETMTTAQTIVSSYEHGEKKEIQLVFSKGKISWTVRHFDDKMPVSSSNHACLIDAIMEYNEI